MNKIKLFGLAMVCGLGLYSCCKENCTRYNSLFYMMFTDFSKDELSTVVIKTYKAGTGFNQLTDSMSFSDVDSVYSGTRQAFEIPDILINDSSDYIIVLPGIQKQYAITNLVFGAGICTSCAKRYPQPTILSYKLNGIIIQNADGNNSILIHKEL